MNQFSDVCSVTRGDDSSSSGAIDEMTAELVGRSLEFGELTAEDLMTPRQRVDSLEADATVADLIWATYSADHYLLLASRGWSPERYAAHLADLWTRLFLADP